MGYVEERADYRYYKYLRNIIAMLGSRAESVIDVGSNGVDLISYLSCKRKVSLDLHNPVVASGVKSVKEDFLKFECKEKFDLCTCFQVLEHIDDEHIEEFASKLIQLGGVTVVTVPYKWPKNVIKGHLQDPVDEKKLCSWFKRKPVFMHNILEGEKSFSGGRLLAIFVNEEVTEKVQKLNQCNFFMDSSNFNQEKYIVMFKKYERVMQGMEERYASIARQILSKDALANVNGLSKEEILKKAMVSEDGNDSYKFFELGETIYPFWLDRWGHAVFFKEWIRCLLSVDRYEDARNLFENKKPFYSEFFNVDDLEILFVRYSSKQI